MFRLKMRALRIGIKMSIKYHRTLASICKLLILIDIEKYQNMSFFDRYQDRYQVSNALCGTS